MNLLKRMLKEAVKWGDMLKSVYDPNTDGVVVDSDKLEGSTKAQVQDHTPKAHTLASHSTKAHNELTGVTASQHHTKTTDHGALGGRGDDDHTQYLTTGRHDTTTRHPKGVIKKATGSASGEILQDTTVCITMHECTFSPNYGSNAGTYLVTCGTHTANYVSRTQMWNPDPARNYYWYWQYLSSSGKHQIWVIINKKGQIQHCWEANDPSYEDSPDISPIQLCCRDTNKEILPIGWKQIHLKLPSDFGNIKLLAKKEKKSISQMIIERKKINPHHSKIEGRKRILKPVDVLEDKR